MLYLESDYIKQANNALAQRFRWLSVISIAFAATLFWGVAPAGFLVWCAGGGILMFALSLLMWRCRSSLPFIIFAVLSAFFPPHLSQRYGVSIWGIMGWQGLLLSLVSGCLLLALFALPIRRICRLPVPVA